MYKDKDKQKQANKVANKRYRDKLKGITQGESERDTVIPCDIERDTSKPAHEVGSGCTKSDWHTPKGKAILDDMMSQLNDIEPPEQLKRKPLPGDEGYQGVCQKVDGEWKVVA